jgi:hypothetical protein
MTRVSREDTMEGRSSGLFRPNLKIPLTSNQTNPRNTLISNNALPLSVEYDTFK